MARDELQSILQRDGRTHDRNTQEASRLKAVERFQEGDDVASVMASYGLSHHGLQVLGKTRGRGRGKCVLAARNGTGRLTN